MLPHSLSLLLSTAFSLFLLMDAIGNVPVFISVLRTVDPKKQKKVILRELLMALAIIVLFAVAGEQLLSLFGISHSSVLITGGIILFLVSIKMVFSQNEEVKTDSHSRSGPKEPFLVPLAVPLVAGPAVLAAVILYSGQQIPLWVTLGAVLLAWAATTVILLSGSTLRRWLGEGGLTACEKLMGLLLTMIAVEMFLEGIANFVQHC